MISLYCLLSCFVAVYYFFLQDPHSLESAVSTNILRPSKDRAMKVRRALFKGGGGFLFLEPFYLPPWKLNNKNYIVDDRKCLTKYICSGSTTQVYPGGNHLSQPTPPPLPATPSPCTSLSLYPPLSSTHTLTHKTGSFRWRKPLGSPHCLYSSKTYKEYSAPKVVSNSTLKASLHYQPVCNSIQQEQVSTVFLSLHWHNATPAPNYLQGLINWLMCTCFFLGGGGMPPDIPGCFYISPHVGKDITCNGTNLDVFLV